MTTLALVAVCPASSSLLRLRGVGGSTPSLQPREDGAGFRRVAGTGARDGASVPPPCPQAGSGNRDPWPLGTSRLCPWDTVPRTDKPGGLGTKQTARTGTPRLPPPWRAGARFPGHSGVPTRAQGLCTPHAGQSKPTTQAPLETWGPSGGAPTGTTGGLGRENGTCQKKASGLQDITKTPLGARALSRVRSGRTLSFPPSTRDMVGCRGRREEAARPPGRLRCETPLRARRWIRSALDEPQPTAKAGPCLCR